MYSEENHSNGFKMFEDRFGSSGTPQIRSSSAPGEVFGDISSWDDSAKKTQDKKEETRRPIKYIFEKIADVLEAREAVDAGSVCAWIKAGNDVATVDVENNIAPNITRHLKETATPFLARKKGTRTYYCVRNINRKALSDAIEQAKFELRTATVIYNYEDFSRLVKMNPREKDKDIVHINGLSEVEAEIVRRQITKSGAGAKFAMMRRFDGSWTMAFRESDFINRGKGMRRKKMDPLTAYVNAAFISHGPDAIDIYQFVSDDLALEKKLVDKYKGGLRNSNDAAYIIDPVSPSVMLKITKEDVSLYNIHIIGNVDVEFTLKHGPYRMTEPYHEEFMRHELMAMEYKKSFRTEDDVKRFLLSTARIDYKKKAAALDRGMMADVTVSSVLLNAYLDAEGVSDNASIDDDIGIGSFISVYAEALKQAIQDIDKNRPPKFLTKEQAEKLKKYLERNGRRIVSYTPAANMLADISIKVRAPEEMRVAVQNELDRIKKEMHYEQDKELEQEIADSRRENEMMQKAQEAKEAAEAKRNEAEVAAYWNGGDDIG